jgi:CubicO group peptidase (beta-lactamase class C family)
MVCKACGRRELLKRIGATGALASLGLLCTCAEEADVRAPAPAQEPIASNPLDTTRANQAATFRNIDRLAPTRVIGCGALALALPTHSAHLGSFDYEYEGSTYKVDDYMRRNRTSGLLILKGGAIALERYRMGNSAQSRWTSFSVAKSVTSTLIGAALKDGSIASLDDGVDKYVTQLKGSAFEGSSIRDLLSMTSGVRWDEDYSIFHQSDIERFERAIGSQKKGAVMELIRTRPRAAAPGSVFNYSTGDSYVLGAVVAAATKSTLSDYLSQKIWARLGMETDGYWLLDSPDGLETGGDNFSATLRDYARFGLFFLREGVIGSDAVLPAGWRDLATKPHTAVAAYGRVDDDPLGYGYHWWAFPTGTAALPYHDGAFTAQGIFGQFLYINPKEDIVVVVWSAWRSPWEDRAEIETYAMIGAAAAILRQ